MSQKQVVVEGLGLITLRKRRGARNLRLSINTKGQVNISLPSWAPYSTGISFAKSRADWIKNNLEKHTNVLLESGQRIGKSYRLYFRTSDRPQTKAKIKDNSIEVISNLSYDDPSVQAKAIEASEKALRREAEILLPQRLASLAIKYGFSYREVRIRKLSSRWGSCSQNKSITLSIYLLQMPWHLIDYVLIHELTHTQHLNHGSDFWKLFEHNLPEAKKLRKEIRNYKPRLEPHLQSNLVA